MRHLLVLVSLAAIAAAWLFPPPSINRGPYLQSQTHDAVTVVARTASSESLTLLVDGRALSSPVGTTHVWRVDGLDPGVTYPYSIEGWTAPAGWTLELEAAPTDDRRFRFLAFGDSGNGSSAQMAVAARMVAEEDVDFALGLGDLVYESGQASGFDPRLFVPYAGFMHRIPFWPTLGNHDSSTSNGAPFYDAFYCPTDTGAPGHPSNTERYYSFDFGSAHFVCLDSESSSTSPSSAQAQWLVADLAANQDDRWRFVFMHHPPYTKGSHDSDSESELRTLRSNLVPIFDAWNVDVVLVGHSHVYERSYLAREGAIVQSDPTDYTKPPPGALYIVSGCAGKTSTSGPMNHPLMARGVEGIAGYSLIDVAADAITGQFIDRDGNTLDTFELRKGAAPEPHKPPHELGKATAPALAAAEWSNGEWFEPNYGPPPGAGIWTSAAELFELPTTGPAWARLLADADALGPIDVGNQDEDDDSRALAAAMVAVRLDDGARMAEVQAALLDAMGTEAGAPDSLGISRNACALVLAADLITWAPPEAEGEFRAWVDDLRGYIASGRSIVSTHEDRPNNWGTHAGASRIAIALYLDDRVDLDAAAQVFRGWLGDRSAYSGFEYGDLCWQASPSSPVGINPPGALGGVLPDDQRRSGLCPPSVSCENYVWEALQGAVTQAELLHRAGYPAWTWSEQALRRALEWLHASAACPASGNDTWIPWLVNARTGSTFPAPSPTQHGRAVGWGDWLYP